MLLAFFNPLAAAPRTTIPAFTPVFAEPDLEGKALLITNRPIEVEILNTELVLTQKHPLARYWHFSQVRLPDGATGYMEPQVSVEFNDAGKPIMKFTFLTPWWRLLMIWAVGIGLIVTLVKLFYHFTKRQILPERNLHCWLILLIMLIRQALLLALVQGAGNIIASPADDHAYFDNAVSLMHWDFSRPWLTTLGHSLFYIPFILFTGARTVGDIMVPFSYFSGLVLGPLSLAVGYLIAHRLTGNLRVPCIAMILWAILPFFYQYNPDFSASPRIFVSGFQPMNFQFTLPHYETLIATGFNAMSDVSSTLLTLVSIYLALRLPSRMWSYAALAAVYAFACLIRINNVCFIPVLAFIVLYRFSGELFSSWRYFLTAGAIGCVAFLLVFAPQFAINCHFSDRLLGFGYITQPETVQVPPLFSLAHFQMNAAYLAGSSHLIWVLGICGLWFMRDRARRTILSLWIFPVIAFFLLYLYSVADPVRFILTAFPAFFIAMAGWEFRGNLRAWEWGALAVTGAAWILLEPNATLADWRFYLQEFHIFHHPLLFRPFEWVVMILLAGGIAALYKHPRLMLFLLAVSILNLFGHAYLLVLLLTAAFIRSLVDAAILLPPRFKRFPAHFQRINSGPAGK